MSYKPWLDEHGRPTTDPQRRALEVIRRVELLSGYSRPVACPACRTQLYTQESIEAVFATYRSQATNTQMPVLLVKCQRCPYMFVFDVGQNGFGDLPERKHVGVLPKGVSKLKDLPCYESKGAPLEQQLLHIMLRAPGWAPHERPENHPLWWPKDFGYHLSHLCASSADEAKIAKALVQLQKDGTVERTDGGWCVIQED